MTLHATTTTNTTPRLLDDRQLDRLSGGIGTGNQGNDFVFGEGGDDLTPTRPSLRSPGTGS